jgi:hypothetical protein
MALVANDVIFGFSEGVVVSPPPSDVPPPATSVWYDPASTLEAGLAMLRLEGGDVDADRISALIPAAAGNIDAKLDGYVAVSGPPAPSWAQTALEMETVAIYRAQGNDIVPYASLGGAAPYRDALVGGPAVSSLVAPHKARWGIS